MSDPDAELAAFCRREHPRLVGALSLYCGDALVAEEIAQEALYRACRRWAEVGTMAAPGAWVHRVAINLANSAYRRRKAERRATQRHRALTPTAAATDAGLGGGLVIREALAALPERQRAALVLRHYAGYSVAETADLLSISEGAVKQLAHRATAALRARLLDSALPEVPDVR